MATATVHPALTAIRKGGAAKVKVACSDIDGILRGKYLHKDKFEGAVEGGFGFCDVVFGWDVGDVTYDNAQVTGWQHGFPDALARLDLDTHRQVPWDGNVDFFLGEFINALMDDMLAFGVPIEGLHTETGPGVYEAALGFSEALAQADRAVLFKTGAKEIGARFGIMPSFMAKWSPQYPGCSGHIHQSLSDGKKNLFHDAKNKNGMSRLFESYLAGQLACLLEFAPMYWPTV